MSKKSGIEYYRDTIERLRARLRDIADDCASVAKDEAIDEAERRTWRFMATKARRYAEEK